LLGVPMNTVQSWTERGVPERWQAIVATAIKTETQLIQQLADFPRVPADPPG
jgi:hypothetical protein